MNNGYARPPADRAVDAEGFRAGMLRAAEIAENVRQTMLAQVRGLPLGSAANRRIAANGVMEAVAAIRAEAAGSASPLLSLSVVVTEDNTSLRFDSGKGVPYTRVLEAFYSAQRAINAELENRKRCPCAIAEAAGPTPTVPADAPDRHDAGDGAGRGSVSEADDAARMAAAEKLYDFVASLGVHGDNPIAWKNRTGGHKRDWLSAVDCVLEAAAAARPSPSAEAAHSIQTHQPYCLGRYTLDKLAADGSFPLAAATDCLIAASDIFGKALVPAEAARAAAFAECAKIARTEHSKALWDSDHQVVERYGAHVAGIMDVRARTTHDPAPSAEARAEAVVRAMSSAPLDGTLVGLVIPAGARHALENREGATRTVGSYQDCGVEDFRWIYARWDWEQDCFGGSADSTDMVEPIGWFPLAEPMSIRATPNPASDYQPKQLP